MSCMKKVSTYFCVVNRIAIHTTCKCNWQTTIITWNVGQRLNLDITLVDADSGIVRATRQVSLSVSFSRKMCASVNRQFSERYLASWNLEDFQKRCREIYAEYPQSVDITRAPGCIICQAPEIQPFYLEEKNVQM